ncbi:nucleotidyltransferase domain-containing protein [Actinoplanes sp. DH11]|uniref:nucleotidyltransferase domain-containing protein n=1 Tax=Actinoplanes sp. DH11 TaxID=2857011 RepID=UPI001E336824|nr:nucleotidyltransferase domain-containing protein [Actinoplanes sp. DH11]
MQPTLRRLDELAALLAGRDDVVAVLALGSAGAQRGRLDEHSDLDFFLVVDEKARWRYAERIDWLEAPCPILFSFAHERNGRKALYEDGVFAEYVVVTPAELPRIPFAGARVVWRRADAPPGLTESQAPVPRTAYDTVEFHLNEALTNLYVGLRRELRGERLSASRFIQSHAVDRVVSLLRLSSGEVPYRDVFDPARRVERAYAADVLPLAEMVPGYAHNVAAARAVFGWLTHRYPVHPGIGAAIRALLTRSGDYS